MYLAGNYGLVCGKGLKYLALTLEEAHPLSDSQNGLSKNLDCLIQTSSAACNPPVPDQSATL
jgi:hypothetical protein